MLSEPRDCFLSKNVYKCFMTYDINALKSEHLKRQSSASNPVHSVWVSANAGAGKTHILVERIIRLLLPPYSCPPHKILCLTYTKAAATEMTERLFKRLGSWIIKNDTELKHELTTMIGKEPSCDDIIIARRLFAKMLESLGELKIQTIHGFCERILRCSPIEADINKDFSLISDVELKNLYIEALEDLASYVLYNPTDIINEAFKVVSYAYDVDTFIDLLINSRKVYYQVIESGHSFWDSQRLADCLGLPLEQDIDCLYDDFFNLIDETKIVSLMSALGSGSKTDIEKAEKLKNIRIKNLNDFDLWSIFFLDKEGKKMLSRERFVTNQIKTKFLELSDYLYELYDSFKMVHQTFNAYKIYHLTKNVSVILLKVYEYVDKIKSEKGLCDFDDIIIKTKNLLTDSKASRWILWKLDGGIDHILVDEAQDTSPEQWDIIRSLTQDFFTEQGAYDYHRTIFAVGDEKQSIYGFQGAAPEKMTQNCNFFSNTASVVQHKWTEEYLRGSFRSSPAVMRLVDNVFKNEATSGVLFGNTQKIEHYAVSNQGPGYIEVMPPVIPLDNDNQDAWTRPLDAITEKSPKIMNAKNIANKIQKILQSPDLLPSTGRPAEPKDIMILLQKRDATMRNLIRELKSLDIPVSGLDRVYLLEEIAVLDLLAVIDFILCLDDDLTLAQVLRSPLCRVSEEELFILAYNRTGTLFDNLALRHQENESFNYAYQFLSSLISKSEEMLPYEFLSFILENCQGRKKFIARLGLDCLDVLDELLNKALDFSVTHSPSLQQFVYHIRMAGGNQKREIDTSNNAVQIMTVHGSKGLESPIVFLPDCCDPPKSNSDLHKRFIMTTDMIPMIIKEGGIVDVVNEQKDFLKKRDHDEYRRLLYVALTRAKDWLFISGKLRKSNSNSKEKNYKINETSWYSYILKGLLSLEEAEKIDTEDSQFATYIYRDKNNTANHYKSSNEKPKDPLKNVLTLPDWVLKMPLNENIHQKIINPSMAIQKNNTYRNDDSRQKGIIIHKLLELLIDVHHTQRQNIADNFLNRYDIPYYVKKDYIEQVLNVFLQPEFSLLLSPNGLSEVPIIGTLLDFDNLSISGQIDRMVILPTEILIADYKTDKNLTKNNPLPDSYLLQMALYKVALQNIYPLKTIKCFIIAIDTLELIEINAQSIEYIIGVYQEKYRKKYNKI